MLTYSLKRINSFDEKFKKLYEDSEGSVVNEDETSQVKIKKLQNILKLKRKSTVDHFGFTSNLLLVPGAGKSQQSKASNSGVSNTSQTDMLSALGYRNDIERAQKRLSSFIVLSPTLLKSDKTPSMTTVCFYNNRIG